MNKIILATILFVILLTTPFALVSAQTQPANPTDKCANLVNGELLTKCYFDRMNLGGKELSYAKFNGAILLGAKLQFTNFLNMGDSLTSFVTGVIQNIPGSSQIIQTIKSLPLGKEAVSGVKGALRTVDTAVDSIYRGSSDSDVKKSQTMTGYYKNYEMPIRTNYKNDNKIIKENPPSYKSYHRESYYRESEDITPLINPIIRPWPIRP